MSWSSTGDAVAVGGGWNDQMETPDDSGIF